MECSHHSGSALSRLEEKVKRTSLSSPVSGHGGHRDQKLTPRTFMVGGETYP
jgi:hypothetical protein